MRKVSFAAMAVLILSAAAFAQGSYSGTWTLDKEKSTMAGPMRVESMTLTVTQTDKEIKIETATKRMPPADGGGAPAGGAPGRGPGGRGGMGMGDGTSVYTLNGKETKAEVEGPMGKMPVTYKGSAKTDGSLELSSSRTFSGQMGEMTMTTKETWKLSADGKTLTIDRVSTTPRGDQTSKLVFSKS